MCKGDVRIQPWVVEERVTTLGRVAVVRVAQVVFLRIECAQGVGSRVMQGEVTNYQGRRGVVVEQGSQGDGAKGGRREGEIVGIGYPVASEMVLKEARQGEYVYRK